MRRPALRRPAVDLTSREIRPAFWVVAVGGFVANLTSDTSAAVSAGIAVGNTLEAVVGAALVRGICFRPALDRVRAVIALTVGGALISTAIAATSGVTVLTI